MIKKIVYLTLLVLLIALSLPLNAQLAAGYSKFLGNLHYKGKDPLNFALYWNQVTPENEGKWASCEQARDDLTYWTWLDRAYTFAKDNGFVFKEHCLVWGHSSGEPSWICSLSASEQKAEVEEWIQAICERYPDIDLIDVVNEPLHDPPCYKDAIGGDGATGWDWVIWAYETTRKYTNAKLLVNDYNILTDAAGTTNYLQLINLLNDRGLLDGIGCEGHSLESVGINTIKTNLDRLAATGLPIYISEYEARGDDAAQLSIYQTQFPVFWEHSGIAGVTLWGYVQNEMWRNEGYLITTTGEERPALVWVRDYLQNGATPPPPPSADCTNLPVWEAAAVYEATGTRVQYNGHAYENNWYSSGQNPETYSGQYQVWKYIGVCRGGSTTPTPTVRITPSPTPSRTPSSTGAAGDVNNDGAVNIVDALMVAQYSVGLSVQGFVQERADVDCNGQITIVDALIIAQLYVGLLSQFPC